VGRIEFTRHLGHQIGQISVVVDGRKLRGIGRFHGIPVNSVKIRLVEFVFDLTPAVLEHVGSFRNRLQRHHGIE